MLCGAKTQPTSKSSRYTGKPTTKLSFYDQLCVRNTTCLLMEHWGLSDDVTLSFNGYSTAVGHKLLNQVVVRLSQALFSSFIFLAE